MKSTMTDLRPKQVVEPDEMFTRARNLPSQAPGWAGSVRQNPASKDTDSNYERQLRNEINLSKRQENRLLNIISAAEEADKTKTMFLCNVAHELRTPLNAIIGFSDIIKSELYGPCSNEKYLDYANDIHQAGTFLLRLINDLLDVSRLEIGEFSLTEEDVDLTECINGCVSMLQAQAQKKKIVLSQEVPDKLPSLRADKTRIQQILVNLLSNAVKFTPPGGRVIVSVGVVPNGNISITVSDTGIGIKPEHLKQVFETFRQIPDLLLGSQQGVGLGLPLAKKLTECHDGMLELHSVPGHGTRACVTFPASRIKNWEVMPHTGSVQRTPSEQVPV